MESKPDTQQPKEEANEGDMILEKGMNEEEKKKQ